MAQTINASGTTTRLTLNTVAAAMAATPGDYYVSMWAKKKAVNTGNYTLMSCATAAANNAAMWAESLSGTTVRIRTRAGGTDSALRDVSDALTDWSLLVFKFSTAVGAFAYAGNLSLDGGAFGLLASSAGTSVAIDRLTFGAGEFNSSVFSHVPNLDLAYIGVWSDLTTGEIANLATQAPHLVAPDTALWTSDADLVQVGGSVTETITVVGSDIAQSDQNPDLILSLDDNTSSRVRTRPSQTSRPFSERPFFTRS